MNDRRRAQGDKRYKTAKNGIAAEFRRYRNAPLWCQGAGPSIRAVRRRCIELRPGSITDSYGDKTTLLLSLAGVCIGTRLPNGPHGGTVVIMSLRAESAEGSDLDRRSHRRPEHDISLLSAY